jgi:hypothetical protein
MSCYDAEKAEKKAKNVQKKSNFFDDVHLSMYGCMYDRWVYDRVVTVIMQCI